MDFVERIPRFKSCCLYVPLRTATVIIAWFSVIVACLYILVSAICLSIYSNKNTELENHHVKSSKDSGNYTVYWSFVLITGLISIIPAVLAVVGINRDEPNYVKIFLIWKGINFTVEILIGLVTANILLLLILAFRSYLWLIVFSYYKDMCEEKQRVVSTPT